MSKFFAVLKKIFKDKDLRKKSLIVLGLFLAFRFLAHVPVSGVNVNQLKALFDQNQFLGLISSFLENKITIESYMDQFFELEDQVQESITI